MKRYLIAFGAVAALVVCGLLLAPLLVPQQQLKAQITESFEAATGWKLRLDGRTSVDLFPTLAVEVDSVGVAGVAGADGVEFAQVEKARFELNSLRLFTGGNIVESVELFKPQWTLEFDQDGAASWQPLLVEVSEQEGTSQFAANIAGRVAAFMQRMELETVNIHDGGVAYSEPNQKEPLVLSNIDLLFTLEKGGDGLTAEGALSQDAQRYQVGGRVGSIRALGESQATAIEAHVSGPSGEAVRVNGQLAFGERPVGSLNVNMQLPQIAEFAKQHGVLLPENVGSGELVAELQFRQRGVRTKNISITAGSVGLGGNVALTYLEDGYELKGQISGQALDFEQVLKLSGLNYQASGFANMDASFYGVGQTYDELISAIEIDGGAILRKGRISGIKLPELLAVEGREESIDDMDLTVAFSDFSKPVELKGTARWQGEQVFLQGGLRSDANVDLSFSSEMFSGSVTGPYSLFSGFAGILAFQTDDLNNFARWYGHPLPRYMHGKKLRVAGRFSSADNELTFNDASFELDETKLSGSGSILTGEMPKLSGELVVEGASFDRMFSRHDRRDDKGENAYDFSVLRDFDLDLALAIKNLTLGSLKGQDADLTAKLEGGHLALDVKRVSLFQGEGAGKLLLNGATVKPGIEAEFSLRGVDAAPFLSSLGDMPRVDGNLYAELDVNTTGQTPTDLWENMTGAMSFQLGNGLLYELDVDRLVASVGNGQVTGWPFADSDSTIFSSWGADVAFGDGTAEFRGLTLQSENALVEGRGSINMKDGEVLWYLQPSMLDQSKLDSVDGSTQQTAELSPLKIRGSLNLPSFERVDKKEYASATSGTEMKLKKVSEKLASDLEDIKTVEEAKRQRAEALKEAAKTEIRDAVESAVSEATVIADVPEKNEEQTTASVDGTEHPVVTEVQSVTGEGPMVLMPVAKPDAPVVAEVKPKAASKSKLAGAPKRDLKRRDVVPRGPGNVDVEAVAAGTADTDETLSSLEEAFGMPAGFLSD